MPDDQEDELDETAEVLDDDEPAPLWLITVEPWGQTTRD